MVMGITWRRFFRAFAVGFLGLVETGILSSAANDVFIATCFGIGAVGPWLIMWALFTAVFAIGARSINLPAFSAFSLAVIVLVVLAIANLGGTASWTGTVAKIGCWVALADGFAAGYRASAIVPNVTRGREVLP